MRYLLVIALSVFLVSCSSVNVRKSGAFKEAAPLVIEEPMQALVVGEKLIYAINWIGIPAGYITLEVKEITRINDRFAYHVIAQISPNSFFKFFHDLEYTVHSYIDTQDFRPVRFYKTKALDGSFVEESFDFNYINNSAIWKYSGSKSDNKFSISGNIQDLLSVFYLFRTKDIKIATSYPVNIVYDGKVWPVSVVFGHRAEVKIKDRNYLNVVVAKLTSDLEKYIVGYNNLEFYLSLDKKRLPLLFKTSTNIGNLSGVLVSYN